VQPQHPAFVVTYGISKVGKTTDAIYSFPRAFFMSPPGALNSAAGVVGVTIPKEHVWDPPDVQNATLYIPKIAATKKFDAIVVDDFSILAQRTLNALQKPLPGTRAALSGWDLWGALYGVVLEFRDAGRRCGLHLIVNCLAGDTPVLTREGWKPIRELRGDVTVLSRDSVWRNANFRSFGVQPLYRVTFVDGSTVDATADHKWYVTRKGVARAEPIETTALAGWTVPLVAPPKPPTNREAVLHGFIYGDGSVGKVGNALVAIHTRAKADAMVPLFREAGYDVTTPDYCVARISGLPKTWKDLPADSASLDYWRGFIVGLLAADGTVDKRGGVIIYQSDAGALERVRLKAIECGFSCTPLYLQRAVSPFTGEPAPCWRFSLRRATVCEAELLLAHHRANFANAGLRHLVLGLKVKSVEPLFVQQEVFCCVEPETHTFAVTNGILTGQCHERAAAVMAGLAQRGGPALPGKLPEQLPTTADLVLHAVFAPNLPGVMGGRTGWSGIYRCAPADNAFVTGDRNNVTPDPAPMNLAELLRAAEYGVARASGLEWMDDAVRVIATELLAQPPAREKEVLVYAVKNLFHPSTNPQHVTWVLRDAVDRVLIARTSPRTNPLRLYGL
jgi:hypothetical protein